MKETTKLRALELAISYKENYSKFHTSLGTFADFIDIPKSTLRGLFKVALPEINSQLSKEIDSILEENIHDKNYNISISDELKQKVLLLAKTFVIMNSNGGYATIRTLSSKTHVSRSTIHDYLSKYLPEIDPEISLEVQDILSYNRQVGQEKFKENK